MKKRYIFLIIIVLLIGVPILSFIVAEHNRKQEINNFASSSSTKEFIEQKIRQKDPKAFTDEGIIKSYEIDYDSIQPDPMGGFSIAVYINNDMNQYLRFSFLPINGVMKPSGGSVSSKLDDMLEER